MTKLKLTNKICGECETFLYSCDELEGFYCANCNCLWVRKKNESTNNRPVSKEEFDNLLIACLKTPPLRLKDLKARLKKEREEKRKRTEQ